MLDQPRWLDIAWTELGVAEVAGADDNPRIVQYYADAGFPDIAHDEVAWCAAFVGACLARSGYTHARSLRARSYLDWGTTLSEPRLGAIAVFPRGGDPALGHVGFVIGVSSGAIALLSGNQSNAVRATLHPRADLLGLRWPAAPAAAPHSSPNATIFDAAFAHVLEMEGGWTDDRYDPGGPTNLGITLATLARHRGLELTSANEGVLRTELEAINPALAREIYVTRYWQPARCDDLPAALALMHFDAAVNHGVTGAARLLQQALAVTVDAEIGPETLAAARARGTVAVVAQYAELRRARYRSLSHFWRFGRGWLARVRKTETAALAIARAATDTVAPPQKDKPMTTQPSTTANNSPSKWWGESLTIWGALLTALTTVLPIVGPIFGVNITAELVQLLGEQIVTLIQALGGVLGTLMTIFGRARAEAPLMRRDVSLRV
jgi:uncharacterized protein (TIGR02594 family)